MGARYPTVAIVSLLAFSGCSAAVRGERAVGASDRIVCLDAHDGTGWDGGPCDARHAAAGTPTPEARLVTSFRTPAALLHLREPRQEEGRADAAPAPAADPGPLTDDSSYSLAWEYERNNDYVRARRVYADLVARFPDSTLVPFAVFAVGEMYWNESQAFGAYLPDALRAYGEVAADRSATNTLVPFALLRVGQIHEKSGGRAKAREAYEKLAKEFPGSDAAQEISAWAKR